MGNILHVESVRLKITNDFLIVAEDYQYGFKKETKRLFLENLIMAWAIYSNESKNQI